jgi:hypothetical protein
MSQLRIEFMASSALQAWQGAPLAADGPIMVMPFIDRGQAQQAAQLMASRAGASGLILAIEDEAGAGFIRLVNLAFLKTQSTHFGYVAQDAFAGRQWLRLAIEALGSEQVLLGFNDGKWAGALAGFGLAKRAWAMHNYQGDFFHPSYQRHFADAELTLLAMQSGKYAYEPNSLLVEVDWQKDQGQVDAADRQLFLERKASRFDGKVTHPQLLGLFS